MSVKLLTEHHSEFLRLKEGCTGSSEYTLVKKPHRWKSHVGTHFTINRMQQCVHLNPDDEGKSLTIWNQVLDIEDLTYTTARVFVLRIRVSCAFPTHCTCVEFKLRMEREYTYFETHEYSLAAL